MKKAGDTILIAGFMLMLGSAGAEHLGTAVVIGLTGAVMSFIGLKVADL